VTTPNDPSPSLQDAPIGPQAGSGSGERHLIDAVLGQEAQRPEAFDSSASRTGALPPPDAFPGYDILHEIHRGGQGVVYLALQRATKRRVAIKILHEGPFAGTSGRSRFEREVQILGQLNHPNIVHIHDSGVASNGSFFYVMDYISGRPLDDLIEGKSGVPAPQHHSGSGTGSRAARRSSSGSQAAVTGAWATEDILRLFIKICDAVNAAHLRGVIHRDLKPANIRVDQRGEPVVVDFGLAKVALAGMGSSTGDQPAMTMTGQFIGSLPWASPEQADGSPDAIDVRTDVYSLGVILYQLLTGKFPYAVLGNMRDVLDNILRAEPARPSSVGRRVNSEIETIVLKCLAKDRARRYQSAGEVARDLERYLNGEAIEAKRDSAMYLISKTLKRHRVTAGVFLSFAALISISAVGMTFLYQAERQTSREEQKQRIAAVQAKTAADDQKARAERNFAAGRALARSFMYDFSRDIGNLRGATPARERLAREAAAYLGSLRGEVGDDPALLRELADAFDQLGRIQGGLYLPRVGDTEEAAKSFAEARTVRMGLLKRFPDEPKALEDAATSAQQEGWIAERGERYEEAFGHYQRAIEWLASAEAKAPADSQARRDLLEQRYRMLVAQGDAKARLGEKAPNRAEAEDHIAAAQSRYDRAQTEYWAPRLAADANDAEAKGVLSILASKKASIGTSRGRAAIDEAERLAEALGKGNQPSPAITELLIEAAARFDEAIARATPALERFGEIAADAPASGAADRDIYVACNNLGFAVSGKADILRVLEEKLGITTLPAELAKVVGGEDGSAIERSLRTKAATVYARGLAVASRLSESDPKNIEGVRDWAVMLNKVGNERRWLARLDAANRPALLAEAERSYADSLRLRAGLYKTDATARHLRDLGLAEFKMGQINLAYATLAVATGPDRDAKLRQAEQFMTAAQTRFEELRTKHGALTDASPAVVETRDALRTIREAMKSEDSRPK
jgi:serine/threonine protein kinase/tetratricopeptide (TPR) repeat protein